VLLKREITFAMPFQVGTAASKVILVLISSKQRRLHRFS